MSLRWSFYRCSRPAFSRNRTSGKYVALGHDGNVIATGMSVEDAKLLACAKGCITPWIRLATTKEEEEYFNEVRRG